jgi:HTH-type transcriptional regulator, sugar sensing transcriptional regulator
MKNSKVQMHLEQFGFSENEVKLYIGLLELGASTVLELAKHTKLNRTTTHMNIESLIQKGLVSHLKVGAKRKIIAEPPEKLNILLDQEKIQVKRKEEALPDLIKTIYDSVSNVKENTHSEVKYYEGIRSVSFLYDEILKADVVKSYVNSEKILHFFPENTEKFYKAVLRGCKLWDLQEKNPLLEEIFEKFKEHPNYYIKFFPEDIKIHSMDYLIYEDCIATIQGGDFPLGIVIKNKFLANNARTLYDLMWRLLA